MKFPLGAVAVVFVVFVGGAVAQAQSCAPPPAGLIAWWPGDGNAQDIVGSNDGTLVNGATFAPESWAKRLAWMESMISSIWETTTTSYLRTEKGQKQ